MRVLLGYVLLLHTDSAQSFGPKMPVNGLLQKNSLSADQAISTHHNPQRTSALQRVGAVGQIKKARSLHKIHRGSSRS